MSEGCLRQRKIWGYRRKSADHNQVRHIKDVNGEDIDLKCLTLL
jgi:hypothetical protein